MQGINPWGAFFFGVVAAFTVMICWKLLRKLFASKNVSQAPAFEKPEQKVPIPAAVVLPTAERGQFVAAIAAALASAMGTEPQGLRIRSIRRLGAGQPDRAQFVAAVSVALASAMGTEPQGLRIRSIRRLSAGQPDRAQFAAAIAAALAVAMGTEPQGLRIHSIKAV